MSTLFDTARGTKWSFSFEVQGFPWVYTDGVASWTGKWGSPYVELPGTLASREFALKWLSDPKEPLNTGSGVTFDLIDDGTDIVFRTWSKEYRGRSGHGRLTSTLGAGSGDTTVYITPTSASELLAVDSFMFLGHETVKVTNASTPGQRTITRAQFSTLRDEHRVFDTVRPSYTTSPTVYGGRVATLWVAPVDPLTGLLDAAEATPIWAGVIDEARIVDEQVRVNVEPLSSLLKSAWPAVIPSAVLLPRKVPVWDPSAQGTLMYYIDVRFDRTGEAFRLRLGQFDDVGTYAALPLTTPVDVSVDEYLKWVRDTIVYFADNDVRSPYAGITNFRMGALLNLSAVSVTDPERRGEVNVVAVYNSVRGVLDTITIDAYRLPGGPWRIPGNGQERILTRLRDEATYITTEQTEIRVKLDRPAHPFQTTWSWDGSDEAEVGYAVVSDGSDHEVIRYTSVSIDSDDPRICTLSGCVRGVSGTEAKAWGLDDNGEFIGDTGAITLIQPLMVAEPTADEAGGNVTDLITTSAVPLYVLLSTPSRGQNGTYDRLDGYRQGLRLPARYVDVAAFESVARQHNLPLLSAFWVNEQGKGKEALGEVLKMAGVYLVERRFTDSEGDMQYGISIESIDMPLATSYAVSITDDVQTSGSRGSTTHNERLVINNTKVKPFISWGAKEAKGEEVFVWDEWSIGEYGQSKALEFKPRAVMGAFNNRTGGEQYRDREAHVAWMYESSSRWFASFGRGSYGGEVEVVAPYTYRVQIGDRVYIDLSTLRDAEGGRGLVTVGHVNKVEHRWGERAGGRVAWRGNIERFCELAPVAQATVATTSTITIAPNTYSYEADRAPFVYGWSARDYQWFDPAVHGGSIKCKGWKIGLYASTVQQFTISSLDLSTGVATVVENAETLFGAGGTFIFTLAPWPDTTTSLSRLYAFVGDGSGLGSGDEAKEYS